MHGPTGRCGQVVSQISRLVQGFQRERPGAAIDRNVWVTLSAGGQIIGSALARNDADSFDADWSLRASCDPRTTGAALPADRRWETTGVPRWLCNDVGGQHRAGAGDRARIFPRD